MHWNVVGPFKNIYKNLLDYFLVFLIMLIYRFLGLEYVFFTNSMLLSPPCSSEFGFIKKVLQPVVKGGPSLWIYRVRMIHVGVPLDTFLYLHIIQYISKPTHLFPSLTVIYHNNIWLLLMIISPYCLELLF